MKLYHILLLLTLCTAHTLRSCPTGIDCDDDKIEMVEQHDPQMTTDLILTP